MNAPEAGGADNPTAGLWITEKYIGHGCPRIAGDRVKPVVLAAGPLEPARGSIMEASSRRHNGLFR
jgi:hypothetical protein